MEIVIRFLILIVVGAMIGGVTNYFAIKMLFRPLRPIYLGKWRLPFTPGLIPKRHDEMAEKLGQVVVEHLLTAEGLTAKFHDIQFQAELNTYVKQEVNRFFDREETLLDLADSIGIENADQRVEKFVLDKLEEKFWNAIGSMREKPIEQWLPGELQQFIDTKIPVLVDTLCRKAIEYFDSDEGKEKVSELIEHFLVDKGTLGNMVKMFLGNESIMNKVQPEIVKFFQQQTTQELFEQIVRREWTSLKLKQLSDFDDKVNYEALLTWLKDNVVEQMNLPYIFENPLRDLLAKHNEWIVEELVPTFTGRMLDYAITKIETIMEKLRLEEIVKVQVESFPLERLEEIVLTISSREFKMITYLGALLGGMIGATQGIMFLLL